MTCDPAAFVQDDPAYDAAVDHQGAELENWSIVLMYMVWFAPGQSFRQMVGDVVQLPVEPPYVWPAEDELVPATSDAAKADVVVISMINSRTM